VSLYLLYTNGVDKNNDDNNPTPIFIVTNKTDRRNIRKAEQVNMRVMISGKYILMSERQKWNTLEYFNLRTKAAQQFKQVNGSLRMATYG
jgi:hypothetical protein